MTPRQKAILARMAWIMLQGDRAMLTAEEIGASSATLAVLVHRGYLRSYIPRAWEPDYRTYALLSEGFYALVGA